MVVGYQKNLESKGFTNIVTRSREKLNLLKKLVAAFLEAET